MDDKILHLFQKEFPQLGEKVHGKELIYLDNAATTLKPRPVLEALLQFYGKEASNVHRGNHFFSRRATEKYEKAREKVSDFIGCDSQEVIFTRGTTEAINLAAQSFGGQNLKEGDEIILTEMEHHSNIVPWQIVAEKTGAKIKVIPVNKFGDLIFTQFQSLVNDRSKILAMTWVSNSMGTVNPIKKYIDYAKNHQMTVLIDAAQAMLHHDISVKDLGCDFLAFSGHKMFGPNGIGVLYGKKDLLNNMPPYQGGGGMIDKVTFEKTTFLSSPERFEAGTPNIGGALGLAAAIDFITSFDKSEFRDHDKQLNQILRENIGVFSELKVLGPEPEVSTGTLSLYSNKYHNADLGELLDQEGIAVRGGHHCTQPLHNKFGISGSLRVSTSVYNTPQQITTFLRVLRKSMEMLDV